jgi:hypothetical protein
MTFTAAVPASSRDDSMGACRPVILAALALSSVVPCALAQQPQSGVVATQRGQVTNYETKDNLKSFHHLDCGDIAALTTDNTPADIYPAARRCLDRGDFQRAARLWAIASLYGRFDTLRVRDLSAHQAILVLREAAFSELDQGKKDEFQTALKALLGSDELADICTQVRRLGPPTYYPTYMTQHGMSAFTGQGGGLKQDFNVGQAWDSNLTDYLHCPGPSR